MSPKVSVIIVSYESKVDLTDCLRSVLNQSYEDLEVIVVDNASTDGIIEFLNDAFPTVKTISNLANLGYGHANNIGIENAEGEFVAVLNQDTVVTEHWLSSLVQALLNNERIGMVTSRIQLCDNPEIVNTCGTIAHYTGLGFCRGLGDEAEAWTYTQTVPAVSGCSFLARKQFLKKLGAFDGNFFMYLEETDLSWRAKLMGREIWLEPRSVVFHKYNLAMDKRKFFHIEKNRLIMLLKCLHVSTLALMTPALLLTEMLVLCYACLKGFEFLSSKIMSYAYLLSHFDQILRKRRFCQRIRQVSDRQLLSSLDWRIPFEQVMSNKRLVTTFEHTVNILYRWLYLLAQRTPG